MAVNKASGTFNTGTSAGTVSVTAPGFQPTCVILMATGQTSAGSAGNHMQAAFAVVDSLGSTHCIAATAQDGAGTSDSFNGQHVTHFGIPTAHTNTWDGEALVTMQSNGFDFDTNSNPFSADYLVSYLALGGDLTCTVSGDVRGNSTGTQTLTVSGFGTCKGAMVLGTGRLGGSAPDTGLQNHSEMFLGFAASDTSEYGMTFLDVSGQGTAITNRLGLGGSAVDMLNITNKSATPATTRRAQFGEFVSDGFSINWQEAAAPNVQFGYVLFGGTNVLYNAGTETTSASAGDLGATTVAGIDIDALLFASSCEDASTRDTLTTNASQSIGFATSTSARNCISLFGENGAGTMRWWTGHFTDRVYCRSAETTVDAILSAADVSDMNTDEEFTLAMDDAEPSGDLATIGWFAIGVAPSAGAVGPGNYYQYYLRNIVGDAA